MTLEISLDYDPNIWAEIPTQWPEPGPSPTQWADALAREMSGTDAGHPGLAAVLKAMATTQRDVPSDCSLVYTGEALVPFVTVDVVALPAEGEAEQRHLLLGRAAREGSLSPPGVEQLSLGRLGAATRVVRFDPVEVDDGENQVCAAVRYVWRRGGVDVVAEANFPGPGALGRILPAVEVLLEGLDVAEPEVQQPPT